MENLTVMDMAIQAGEEGRARCFDISSSPRVVIVASPGFDTLPCEAIRVAFDRIEDKTPIPKLDPTDPLQMTIEQAISLGKRYIIFAMSESVVAGCAVVAIALDDEASNMLAKVMNQCQVELEVSD